MPKTMELGIKGPLRKSGAVVVAGIRRSVQKGRRMEEIVSNESTYKTTNVFSF